MRCLSTNLHGIIKHISIKDNDVNYLLKYITYGELVERQEHDLSDIHSSHPAPAPDVTTTPDPVLPPPITSKKEHCESQVYPNTISTTPKQVSWLDDGCKVTVFLPHIMKTPKRGYLKIKGDEWTFQVGRTQRTLKPLHILALYKNMNILIADGKIVSGWKTTQHMLDLQDLHDIETVMVRRMSLMNSIQQQDLSTTAIK